MEAIAALVAVYLLISAVWLNILATVGIRHDDTLNRGQRLAQYLFVWLIPLFGASFIIHLIFEHSPEVIPTNWIPWPFKKLIYGREIKPNRNRSEENGDIIAAAGRSSRGDIDGPD